ncbi:adenine nucleotide alpha hydrolase [Devosia nitrariae]|uniref:TIGR00268 family protein n=1 Tax=Devosia nitrariae TaxID=2071872 RepID=A0ABQ5W7V4_9HYPH|nr:adenine nucleotide alpha hydrolase [Devosia nitrariae]GLQ56165.1 TIGR00268 family protein [Devosia nitrariae]
MSERLASVIIEHPGLVIATSGGVDSMTLASFAHRLDRTVMMVHAVSPAVPPAATERVEAMAKAQGWRLHIIGSGEFEDPRYRDNPANRCYFCKTNLYQRIRSISNAPIASGTNQDDLADFRPGLAAASESSVIHPYVLAGMDKKTVRRLARELGLDAVAELPAQPCLASRIETGIAISADDLAFVDAVEVAVRALCPANSNVRCRVTRQGIEIELDDGAMPMRDRIELVVASRCRAEGRVLVGIHGYRQGAMFLR